MSKNWPPAESNRGSYKSYIAGFIYSLALTLTAYVLVSIHVNSGRMTFSSGLLAAILVVLALIQLFTQLIFFLHLDKESSPRWNLTVAAFAATVVLILVLGSLWIMTNLNYHHGPQNVTNTGKVLTSPGQVNTYIIQDEGIRP